MNDADDRAEQADRDESENEDLRGVIDDLTVENKKLKQMLRERKVRPKSNTHDDGKLFEVRMHGLNPRRKRELEMLLKNFAISTQNPAPSAKLHSKTRQSTGHHLKQAPSSGTDSSQPLPHTDSGYGSRSRTESATPLNSLDHGTTKLKANNDKNVRTYLHDIPDTLLPHRPVAMSERTKMVLVVKRLEQLFTGRMAVSGKHHQPIQQQEISNSAAWSDRLEDIKQNRASTFEGSREAHIYPHDTKVNLDKKTTSPIRSSGDEQSDSSSQIMETRSSVASRTHSPDQRPTRPLDLDVDRSMMASENMDYLRHLGVPHTHLDLTGHDAGSWMYLNLLISMAQLHTFNVTPSFVRRAIEKVSTKFELSKDGHSVRWGGGLEGTQFAKVEEQAVETVPKVQSYLSDEYASVVASGSTRSKTASTSNAVISSTGSEDQVKTKLTESTLPTRASYSAKSNPSLLPSTELKTRSSLHRQPMMATHRRQAAKLDASSLSAEEASAFAHNDSKDSMNRHDPDGSLDDDGVITFYNNPYFYTDLTHDQVAPGLHHSSINNTSFASASSKSGFDDGDVESIIRCSDACYFTPQFANQYAENVHVDEMKMTFPMIDSAGEAETQPKEFVATGLGGTTPSDNFALDVKIQRLPVGRVSHTNQSSKVPAASGRYKYSVASVNRMALQPSQLPPPTYFLATTDTSASCETSSTSSTSQSRSESEDEGESSIPSATHHNMHYRNAPSSEEEEIESVDMLATAREAQPDEIAAREREYLLTRPGGAHIVAGSLAATVGESQTGSSGDPDESMADSDDGYDDDDDK